MQKKEHIGQPLQTNIEKMKFAINIVNKSEQEKIFLGWLESIII